MAIKISKEFPLLDTTDADTGKILYVSGSTFKADYPETAIPSFVATASFGPFTSSINLFTGTINQFTQSINGFTASFSSSVQSIGDNRYTLLSVFQPFSASIKTFSGTINLFTQSLNTFSASINLFSSSVNAFTASNIRTLNAFSGNVVIQAGNNISITSGSNFITIDAITSSGTVFADDRYVLTSSLTSSVINVGDRRYAFSSTFDTFTGSTNIVISNLNTFSATINQFTQSVNSFSAAFSQSVRSIGDTRYVLTSSYSPFTGAVAAFSSSILNFSQSINTFSATINNFTQSVNGFTASFSASVQSIGDVRYVRTVNAFSGNITFVGGTNVTINSASNVITISASSPGSSTPVTGASNFFVTNQLQVSGVISNTVGEMKLSNSIGRTILSSSLIIPRGGGTFLSGHGIAVGHDFAYDSIHVVDGNMRIEGSGTDLSYIVKDYGIDLYPQFRMGSIIRGGDGDPNFRFIYSHSGVVERSVFEFDNKGIVASIKQTSGSHFEGFISGDPEPFFRLNSSPSMSLELGAGRSKATDVVLRRKDEGHLHIHSQIGVVYATGNLDVAKIYSSDGHLLLSSAFGSVTVSGNLRVLGTVSGSNNTAINGLSGSVQLLAGPNITVTTGAGFIMITGSAGNSDLTALNNFSQSVNTFTASINTLTQSLNTFSASHNLFSQSISTFSATINTFTQSVNLFTSSFSATLAAFTAAFTSSVQFVADRRYISTINGYTGSMTFLAGPNITINSGSGFIMITGSVVGSTPVTGAGNFFVNNELLVSGTIRNPVGELQLTSSATRTIHTGSIILPRGGGTSGGGFGIAIGANLAWDALHIFDGNARIEGNNEYSYMVKRTDMTNGPQFQFGRLAGSGDPKIRFMYSDDLTSERSVFDVTKSGTIGSIKPVLGSHYEGYITGAVQPIFRLNSYPTMQLEFGPGESTTTDIILRRKQQGHLKILSQLSNNTDVTGSVDVANIYSSDGHLHLSSSAGSIVAVSGALKVIGNITSPTIFTGSKRTVFAIFDGGGSVISAGAKAYIAEIPYDATITGWRIVSPISGSVVVDVWKGNYAQWPAVVGNSIAGTEKPTLSNATKNEDKNLTTWTTSVSSGDHLVFNVDSATTVTYVALEIFMNLL